MRPSFVSIEISVLFCLKWKYFDLNMQGVFTNNGHHEKSAIGGANILFRKHTVLLTNLEKDDGPSYRVFFMSNESGDSE